MDGPICLPYDLSRCSSVALSKMVGGENLLSAMKILKNYFKTAITLNDNPLSLLSEEEFVFISLLDAMFSWYASHVI